MVLPRLLSPSKTAVFLVAILSATQSSVSAPTADTGTAVSSAPKPIPNLVPSHVQSLHKAPKIVASTLNTKDGVKKAPPKRLAKRQFQQMSVSAPAILSRPPSSPNTNNEEDAIGAAAEKIKQAADEAVNHMEQVANAAVRNAADEQRDGIDNPVFHGSQDNSYIWPSATPSYYSWPTNVASTWDPLASAAALAAAASGGQGQGFPVVDGNAYFNVNPVSDNQILNDLGQTISDQTLQNSDPSIVPAIISNPDLWRQALNDPNIQSFLQSNTPEGLQPLLDPATTAQLRQNPGAANILVPSLNNPTPDIIVPFINLLDALPVNDKLNLINEGPDIGRLAQTDSTGLASAIDAVQNLRAPDTFTGVSGFRNDFIPPPSVHTDTGSMLFTPNGFEMSPVGPLGGQGPRVQIDTTGQGFDATIGQPLGPGPDIFRGTFGAIPTNLFLPNGGTISFNCVPVYIDANGEQHAASDVPSHILSAFNVGGQGVVPSAFMDQTTDPNTPLTPFLSEVVAENPDILSASQIDDTTVLVNTQGGDDAEKVFSKLQNGWGLQAEDTDQENGLDTVTLENGGTKFQISQPQGFATADILDAKTPGDILSQIGEGASIQLETANAAPAAEAAG
ncbi:hypothetical protein TWF506_001094 [Arthrobotrys conoides]|uniref:Uncharacterized protein n=1 Tax=Arthrobotrys conoides TaxID=74498 RepID=A0AAN8P965_9PEZI